MGKQTSDFRYNTGATKVPWAAVGENYNVHDLMESAAPSAPLFHMPEVIRTSAEQVQMMMVVKNTSNIPQRAC